MDKPRDHHVENRTGVIQAARLFSNIISPPVMFAVLGLAVALSVLPFWSGFTWALVYGFFVSLAPILLVLYLLKTGRITELHMSNTSERHIPYIAAVIFSAIAYLILDIGSGPDLLKQLTVFNMIELATLGIINIFWLISIHATGIMATLVLVGLIFGWGSAFLIVGPFVLAVCWVRLYLKRHTPSQIIAGLLLGAVNVLALSMLGFF